MVCFTKKSSLKNSKSGALTLRSKQLINIMLKANISVPSEEEDSLEDFYQWDHCGLMVIASDCGLGGRGSNL